MYKILPFFSPLVVNFSIKRFSVCVENRFFFYLGVVSLWNGSTSLPHPWSEPRYDYAGGP